MLKKNNITPEVIETAIKVTNKITGTSKTLNDSNIDPIKMIGEIKNEQTDSVSTGQLQNKFLTVGGGVAEEESKMEDTKKD